MIKKYIIYLCFLLTGCSWGFWTPTVPYQTVSANTSNLVIPPNNHVDVRFETLPQSKLSVIHVEAEGSITCNLVDRDYENIIGEISIENESCILHIRTQTKQKLLLQINNTSDKQNTIYTISNLD